MKERMKQPEKQKNMPNLLSHLYWSLAQLDIKTEAVWNELDDAIKELIPMLKLKHIVTILEQGSLYPPVAGRDICNM